jgi:hypothetical protein
MSHTPSAAVARTLVAFVLGLLLVGGVAPPPAAGQARTDVTGTWRFQVETSGGSGTPTMVFKQVGETLTGTYEGQFGKAPLTGTVKGQSIAFRFVIDVQGQTADAVYEGTVHSDGMKGTVDIGSGAATGTFTAKRQ